MEQQKWNCETCGQEGEIEYAEHEDIWTVFNKIYKDHQNKSPDCRTGIDRVRVENKYYDGENVISGV